MAIMVIVLAAILPQLRAVLNSWDSKAGAAETLQNGRALIDHLNRNLSKAVKITAVSNPTEPNGYIQFLDNDSNTYRYDINSIGNYVRYGQVGYTLADLAGPVSSLNFTCYDACDLNNPLSPVTDVNVIRTVRVDANIINLGSLGQDKTFTTSAYLRTNWNSSSLVGWWELDETSGLTAADSSGQGNDGTLINMAGDEWTIGQIYNALEFDGSNDYVNVGDAASLDITDSITVTAWIKPSNPSGAWQSIIANSPAAGQYNYWFYLEGNALKLSVYSSTYPGLTVSNAISAANTWYHVAFTALDGSTMKIFVDGKEVGSGTAGTQHWAGGYTTISDLRPDRNILFAGTIDDVRIYNRALSADEIAQLANILRYRNFNEQEAASDSNESITIQTPDTNEGDLLIAAVATDEDTSLSLAPPAGENWTKIDIDSYISAVTLGAWWKLADASESLSHQFTWSGGHQAYGWMMRFTGHDPTNPINAWLANGQSDSTTPTSPAVTTTVSNCLILRLGAFDDDDITVDAPGLSGHTAITMDTSGSSGLLGCWKLDETSGLIAADSSGQGNDGTLTNMNGTEWTEGHQVDNGALEFDGNNDCVSIGDLGSIVAYTAAAWIKADSLAGSGDKNTYGFTIMASAHSGQGYPLWLTVGKGGATEVTLRAFESSTTGHTTTNANLNTTDWFHIVATAIKGSTAKVYVNGVERLSFTAGTTDWTDIFTIGDLRPGRLICFDGIIDDVRIYNRALSAGEITALYNGEEIGSGEPVSGGAGYIRQSSSGDSGTSNFSLTAPEQSRMLTIAIAPAPESGDYGIRP